MSSVILPLRRSRRECFAAALGASPVGPGDQVPARATALEACPGACHLGGHPLSPPLDRCRSLPDSPYCPLAISHIVFVISFYFQRLFTLEKPQHHSAHVRFSPYPRDGRDEFPPTNETRRPSHSKGDIREHARQITLNHRPRPYGVLRRGLPVRGCAGRPRQVRLLRGCHQRSERRHRLGPRVDTPRHTPPPRP